MSHIYIGLALSFFGVILAYFILSKLLLVAFFLAILTGLHFKDDFIIFRYLATHVASIYLWCCEVYYTTVNMYHQSNNVNLPVRKRIEDNGAVASNVDRLHHRLKTPTSHNLNSTYVLETQPLGSGRWNTNSNLSPKLSLNNSRPLSPLQDLSKLNISPTRLREDSMKALSSSANTSIVGAVNYDKENPNRNANNTSVSSVSSQNISPLLDARLFANVNSPGFCSRLAERLGDTMTHQPQYDTVGAFPVVNLKSQSPKVKVKAPVRVRLAPPTNDLLYASIGARHQPHLGAEESMKSVLQVLKEISRKRIHSNVDEESEDNKKRLRIGESQYDGEGAQHTSLLQQTIQGKRAREESSPNEEDIKKRRKPLQNNEILSSLSSSISIKPPHLNTQKRKALDDPITLTPVLGKLLKVQPEITPPTVTPPPKSKASPQESKKTDTPTLAPTSTWQAPTDAKPVEEAIVETVAKKQSPETDDDGVVSRLLGRMSGPVDQTTLQPIPVKKDVFASTNDLSLSPPKENRLAAMIAVLGGPCEELGITTSQPNSGVGLSKPVIKGKALFRMPETPETPKATKKVTFCDTLTATKTFYKDSTSSIDTDSTLSAPSAVSHGTPLSTLTFGISSSPVSLEQIPSTESQSPSVPRSSENLTFSLSQFSSGSNESKKIDSRVSTTAVSKDSTPSQQPGSFLPIVVSSPLNTSGTTTTSTSNFKLGDFSFGSRVPTSQDMKENKAKQPPAFDSVGQNPFGFGGLPQTAQATSGFPLSMPNLTGQSLQANTTATNEALSKADKSQPNFNMFANLNPTKTETKSEAESKQMLNGLDSSKSSFAFNAPPSLPSLNKPSAPPFSTTAPNANSPFTFGSSATPATTQVPCVSTSSTFQFNAAPQPATALVSSTTPTSELNMFSNAASSPFGAAVSSSSQSPSIFGNSLAQANSTNSLTPASSQSSIFANSAAIGFGVTSQIAENKGGKTTQSNLFGGISNANATSKDFSSPVPSTTESTVIKGFGFGGNNPFGAATATISQPSSTFGNSSINTQASTMFGSGTATQNSNMFSTSATTTGQTPSFTLGKNSKSIFTHSSTTPSFGTSNSTSTPAFGSQVTTSTGAFGSQTTQSPIVFGSQTTSTGAFGVQNTTTTAFGNQNVATNAFGSQNTSTSNAFGNQITSTANTFGGQISTTANAFGSQSSTTNAFGSQNITLSIAFGSQSTTSANAFGNQGTSTVTFGNQNLTSANAFGSQNSSSNNAFGSQNAPTAGAFGNQIAAVTPTFNQSQSNAISNLNSAQTAFNAASPFSLGQSSTNTADSKPSPFGSSPFMFGSSTNKEPGKPVGAAAPFSFGGATAQASPSVTPSQPAAPAFAFGGSQQPPAFGSTATQPATTGPAYAFGQPTAPGSTFQFNAAGPQPPQGGGMFSIGSGSLAPRSKTGALRRRHKPT